MIRLGDVVVAVFDEAACLVADPEEASRLAHLTLVKMLRRGSLRIEPHQGRAVPALCNPPWIPLQS